MTLIYQYENVRFQSYTKYDFEILTKLLNQDPIRPTQTHPDPTRPNQTQTKINYLL